jgi:aspartyl-tRNA synthetase
MNAWAQEQGQPGLGYVFYKDGEGSGPVAKNIGPERTAAIRQRMRPGDGDAVFFVAGDPGAFYKFAGAARDKVGRDLDLVDKDCFRFCWIVDFPMFEWDEDTKSVAFSHNPFSMPQGGMEALETKDPLEILAYQYDIVCNGVELSSGAIRNHRPDIMEKAFAIAGYDKEVLEARFGGMWRALHYGAPPHGGIAPGLDRIVMLLANTENLREVIAFPMNQQAQELLLGAPAPVSEKQLKELHLQLSLTAREKLKGEAAPKAADAGG